MKRSPFCMRWMTLILFCVASVGTTAAADDGWKLPSLNPFKSGSKKQPPTRRASTRVSDDRDNGFLPDLPKLPLPKMQMPKLDLTPWSDDDKRLKSNQPSTFQKLNQGTMQFMNKTKSTLMPWTDDKPPKRTVKKKSSGFFSSWFAPKEEPKQVRTVNDFLAQPRPY